MEPLGDFISAGDWDFISTLLMSNDQLNFTSNALSRSVFENGHSHGLNHEIPPGFFANPEQACYKEMGGINNVNTHLQCAHQEGSHSRNCDNYFYFPDMPIQNYDDNIDQMILVSDHDNLVFINDSFMEEQTGAKHLVQGFANIGMEDVVSLSNNMSNEKTGDPCDDSARDLQLKREFSCSDMSTGVEDDPNVDSSENPRKKIRATKNPRKSKKHEESRKTQKAKCMSNDEEAVNQGSDKQSCSSSSMEGDCSSNPHGGQITTPVNSDGKTRASRGAATDPQSLYARKRRERITERLKILQNLVPNGTKVDISTMLEEAVHYVKFLQLQIKLLSSDELWMYAPIAYNGLDIGLNQIISAQL